MESTNEASVVSTIVNCRLPQAYWRDEDCVLYNGKAEELAGCEHQWENHDGFEFCTKCHGERYDYPLLRR